MRMAILVGARPIFVRGRVSARVPLEEGGWRLKVENQETSKVRIIIESRVDRPNGTYLVPRVVEITAETKEELIFSGPVQVSAEVFEAGKEHCINIFAEAINGS